MPWKLAKASDPDKILENMLRHGSEQQEMNWHALIGLLTVLRGGWTAGRMALKLKRHPLAGLLTLLSRVQQGCQSSGGSRALEP